MSADEFDNVGNRFYHEAQDRMAMLPNYYRWIANQFRSHVNGRVIELGVGAGFVLQHYLNRVEEVVGVDYNRILLQRLKLHFPQSCVIPCELDLRGEWSEVGRESANTVVALDVLEHFEDERAFVEKLGSVLRPNGLAIIKVPAQPKLFSQMDEASGHFRRYDPDRLRFVFERNGFSTLRLRYMNVIGAIAYRRKRRQPTNFSRSVSPRQLRLANVAMPFISAFDVLPLKGLSLVGIFQKSPPSPTCS